MTLSKLIAALIVVLLPVVTLAKEAAPVAEDPVLEKRLMTLSEELRCLVCQNQTLADSQADLAVDLRNQIREQMRGGATDEDVVRFLVARYGDFVLYRPPVKAITLLLWFGPAILLLIGIVWLFRILARRRRQAAEVNLSEAEQARATALLDSIGKEGQP